MIVLYPEEGKKRRDWYCALGGGQFASMTSTTADMGKRYKGNKIYSSSVMMLFSGLE